MSNDDEERQRMGKAECVIGGRVGWCVCVCVCVAQWQSFLRIIYSRVLRNWNWNFGYVFI